MMGLGLEAGLVRIIHRSNSVFMRSEENMFSLILLYITFAL